MRYLVLSALISLALASPAWTDSIIDTSGTTSIFRTSGYIATAQTFNLAAGSDNVLQEYTFWLAGHPDTAATFNLEIYVWGGASMTGSALYSETFTWATAEQSYTASDIGVTFEHGTSYAVAIDLLGDSSTSVHYVSDAYAGGTGLWTNTPNGTWNSVPSYDHRFKATFSAVPEPGGLALLGLGLAGLAWRMRRSTRRGADVS